MATLSLVTDMGFNSRTRVGCDWDDRIAAAICEVSIHAPAWGATRAGRRPRRLARRFQFTHPRGVRRTRAVNVICPPMFQFTHPRGVRLR